MELWFFIIALLIILWYVRSLFTDLKKEVRDLKYRMDVLIQQQKQVKDETITEREIAGQEKPKETLNEKAPLAKEPVIEEVPFSVMLPDTQAEKVKKKIDYEKFIGENLFGKIGILVLVVGIGFFVKYAIDKDWINETLRTILGFVAGSVLLFIAERLCKKYRTFSSLLAGGAFAVFYLTVAIAFHYYHLFSQTVAFVILIVITLLMSALAILYDRKELAVISLIGGFIAPFLVSSGAGSYIVLFTYLAILNLSMFGLSLYKKWAEMPVIAFVATSVVLVGYVSNVFFFNGVGDDRVKIAQHLFIYSTLFYFIFLLPVLSILKSNGRKLNSILLAVIMLNNFVYLLLGTLLLDKMNLPFKATGVLSLFIALVNLVIAISLKNSRKDYRFLNYVILGLVITFVSITVPIQLEGNYITLFWASEMVLLLWLYVKSGVRIYKNASVILMVLTLFSYLLDIHSQLQNYHSTVIFLNSMFVTGLYTGVAVGVVVLLMNRYKSQFDDTTRYLRYRPWNAILLICSVLIIYYTFMMEFHLYLSPEYVTKVMFLFTSVSLLSMNCGFRNRFPVNRFFWIYSMGISLNVVLFIVFLCNDVYNEVGFVLYLLPWLSVSVIVLFLYYTSRLYYANFGIRHRYTVYLNVAATVFWLGIVYLFLRQLGMPDEFNAGFSIALTAAGFAQMSLGMLLHQKVLRIISLITFGIVLLKLVLVDLWAMPTLGKIIVFIILGVILLVLSFLYQKLKDVLFKDDEQEGR